MNHNVQPLAPNWQHIYHANLALALLARDTELVNHTFYLNEPLDNLVTNHKRNFRVEFSKLMTDWIISGQTEISDAMLAANPHAKNFDTVFTFGDGMTLTTAYGPRIKEQMKHVIDELTRNPESRQACIMMLTPEDRFVSKAMAEGKTKCEYLCTYGFNFRIRDGRLDMVTSMRSNNYTTTVCQDVFVFTNLQAHIAKKMGLQVGGYYHSAVSGHILPHERGRAIEILKEYFKMYPQAMEDNGWRHVWAELLRH